MPIALTASQRTQLFSLNTASALLEDTAVKVNTGKKINSASDNPFLYFKATSLSQNAATFENISEELSTALNVVKAAEKGLDNIRNALQSAQSRLRDALAAGSSGTPGLVGQKSINADPNLYFNAATTLATAFGIDVADKLAIVVNAKVAGAAKAKTFNFTGATDINTFITTINSEATLGNTGTGENVRAYITPTGALAVAGTGSDPNGDFVVDINFTFTDTTANSQGLSNIFGSAVPTYSVLPSPSNPTGTRYLTTGAITANYSTTRAQAADFYINTLKEIQSYAADSAFAGNNLLQGGNLSVFLNEDGTSTLTVVGTDHTNGKLGLNLGFVSSGAGNAEFTAAGVVNSGLLAALQSDTNINTALGRLSTAIDRTAQTTNTITGNLAVITNRINFAKDLSNVFQTSSDAIVAADVNEESANLVALQTRQQLALQALSITNQAQQGALRLFGG